MQVAGFGGSSNLENEIEKITGGAPASNHFHEGESTLTLGLSPLTWLVLCDDMAVVEKLTKLDRAICAVTDLSSARIFYEIEGDHAALKLAKGALIDFSINAFPVGELRQTVIHHMAVHIIRTRKDCFLISSMRSFGDELRAWLEKK